MHKLCASAKLKLWFLFVCPTGHQRKYIWVCNYTGTFVVICFSKIGEDQSAEDAEDGPPELLVSTCMNLIIIRLLMQIDAQNVIWAQSAEVR